MTMVSRRTVAVAGLPVHVFSQTAYADISGKVVVLFFLHGRGGSAHKIEEKAESIVKYVAEKGHSEINLLVVTFVSIVIGAKN